ncbi:MAG: 3-isopropylmalate dehydrogenase [Planctomycetota bacterium]
MSEIKKVIVLAGDGIGAEVMPVATELLALVAKERGEALDVIAMPIGVEPLLAEGRSLPDATLRACLEADSVLLGALGDPRFDDQDPKERPEIALLALRKQMGVYANLRPVQWIEALAKCSPLRPEIGRGSDMVVVRELGGGIYFGEPRGIDEAKKDARRAFNTMIYTEAEITRIAKRAFELASGRRKSLVSVDKANVLEASRLWRTVVSEVAREFPEVQLRHAFVDAFALELACRPADLDVVLTANLFGDVLSDESAILHGGLGLLPSASLGDGPGLFEPVHGSAPDIAGKDRANPIAMVLSMALMLHHGLGWTEEAERVERAVHKTLESGARSADIAVGSDEVLGTRELGARINAAFLDSERVRS